MLSTAGDLAFAGDLDRRFRAFDVRTGEVLWQARLGTSVQGFPISFAVDGKQYIAVATGLGGGSPRAAPRAWRPTFTTRRPATRCTCSRSGTECRRSAPGLIQLTAERRSVA